MKHIHSLKTHEISQYGDTALGAPRNLWWHVRQVSLREGGAESASLSPGFVGFPQVSSFTCSEMISACSPQKTVKLESNSPNISMETRCIVITGNSGEG